MLCRYGPFFLATLSAFALPGLVTSADWPQFRGADRTDISPDTGLLRQWPADGPKLKWTFEKAGIGYSGPSIVGDKVFIMGTRKDREVLIAITEASGEELWFAEIGSVYENGWGDGPRGTPTVDGDRVYAMGGQGELLCVAVEDGSIIWRCNMDDYGGSLPSWGYCESPLIDGNQLVCSPGGSQGAIVALNKLDGEMIWQSEKVLDGAQYSSIVVANFNGVRQYVQLFMESLVSVNAEDGSLIWESPWPGSTAVVPTPIIRGQQVYVSSGYNAGCKLMEITSDDVAAEVYANKVMKNHHGGIVLVGDYLYGYSDGPGWVCQDFATGETVWSEKDKLGKGAISCADEMLYCIDERDGNVVMIEASPDGWKEHGRFKLEPLTELRKPSGGIWTHPVIVNGKLYLRDQELFFCYDVNGS